MKRRDFFEHVAWTGSGIAWSLSASGLLVNEPASAASSAFSFVQISDSRIGFTRPENPDVLGTFAKTIAAINSLPRRPAFVVHTGDVTHLSKPKLRLRLLTIFLFLNSSLRNALVRVSLYRAGLPYRLCDAPY